MVNNEHQALLPMRLRGLLHLMTFLPDQVLYILMITGFGTSLQTRCLLQPDVLPKYQALNGFLEVRGMAHTQTRGFPTLIYQPLGLTSLPPDLLSSDFGDPSYSKEKDKPGRQNNLFPLIPYCPSQLQQRKIKAKKKKPRKLIGNLLFLSRTNSELLPSSIYYVGFTS